MKQLIFCSLLIISTLLACSPDATGPKYPPEPADNSKFNSDEHLKIRFKNYCDSNQILQCQIIIINHGNETVYPVTIDNHTFMTLEVGYLSNLPNPQWYKEFFGLAYRWTEIFGDAPKEIQRQDTLVGYFWSAPNQSDDKTLRIYSGDALINFHYITASRYQDSIQVKVDWTNIYH